MTQWARTHLPCPDTVNCGSSDAYSERADGTGGFCFACNKAFNNKEFSVETDFTYEYLPRRGITKETHEFFGVKTQIGSDGVPRSVAYVYPNGGAKIRTLKEKLFSTVGPMKKGEVGGWGPQFFPAGSSKAITITEGEDDAMSVWQMLGGYPVYSVKSSGSALFDVRFDYDYLNSFEKIYLCLDDDEPGRKATEAVASVFGHGKVYHVKLAPYKDAHEYLENNAAKEFKNTWWGADRYMPEQVVSSFAALLQIYKDRQSTKRVPWPFPTFQKMTGGIEIHRQYLVSGLEGIGKTEFLHQVVHQYVEDHPEAKVGLCLMEEPTVDTIKIQAGKRLKSPVHLEESEIPDDQIWAAFREWAKDDDRIHFFKHFGSEDADTLLNTIRFMVAACGCELVVFDNYQIATTGRTTDNEREALDYLSTKMAMLVKELPFALISISHENDNELTRGSRNISKTCDVWLNMKRDIKNEVEAQRNIQYLTIFKNRQAGKSGPAGRLYYDQETATLAEMSNELPV